jgi:hypothetical protein
MCVLLYIFECMYKVCVYFCTYLYVCMKVCVYFCTYLNVCLKVGWKVGRK